MAASTSPAPRCSTADVDNTEDFIHSLSSDRHARRSDKADLETHAVTWKKGHGQLPVHMDSCGAGDGRHPTLAAARDPPPGVEYRFNLMANTLAWLPHNSLASIFFCLDGHIIGFALCWIEPATSTCFFVQRGFLPQYRRHMRWEATLQDRQDRGQALRHEVVSTWATRSLCWALRLQVRPEAGTTAAVPECPRPPGDARS